MFQIDPDFQERMFARQIAVMKGQAWNVVETLKTPDHGPLELTRRAKVCVWDDLVDVPVAVPMRLTSSEMRRRAEADFAKSIEEEMDIGAANSSSSAPATGDAGGGGADLLLDITMASPPADLPHPGRFEMALADEALSIPEEPATTNSSPLLLNGSGLDVTRQPPMLSSSAATTPRPTMPRAANSQGPPSRTLNMYSPERQREHQRRFSFATAAGRRNSNTIASQLYRGSGGGSSAAAAAAGRASYDVPRYSLESGGLGGGDEDEAGLEGDLGYAAAEGMEGNRRKVIVERLEPVKTKNPVFTWC